jgi:hypothetical protein
VAHVFTAPAQLESVSLVLAAGLDLFGARTAPSLSFDSLADDFPAATLALTLLALLVGTVLTGRWAQAGGLRLRWK